MPSFWLVETIKNGKKDLKHYEDRDEAIKHLLIDKANKLLEQMPRNSGLRADVFIKIAPEFVEYAETVGDHVVEVQPVGAKKK